MSDIKRKQIRVLSSASFVSGSGWWILSLECGHTVDRRVKRRRSPSGQRMVDPVPSRAYCEYCEME